MALSSTILSKVEGIKSNIPVLKSSDITTILGLLLAIAFVTIGIILAGNPIMYVDIVSVFIVLGGTIGVTVIRFPLKKILEVITITKQAFMDHPMDDVNTIQELIKAAKMAKKAGLLSLESMDCGGDLFFKKAVQAAVDGLDKSQVSSILCADIASQSARHNIGQAVFSAIGDAGPAFGMIGTLIGLVAMLANLSDPSSIGPAMAVALLTTLYGALLANVVALPLADKLKLKSEQEVRRKKIITIGIEGIIDGEHPNIIETRLFVLVEPELREFAGYS